MVEHLTGIFNLLFCGDNVSYLDILTCILAFDDFLCFKTARTCDDLLCADIVHRKYYLPLIHKIHLLFYGESIVTGGVG